MKFFLIILSFLIIISSCSKGLYSPVPGCKGVRFINYDYYVKQDTTTVSLKKNLRFLDEILLNSVGLSADSTSLDQEININVKSYEEKRLNTTKEVVNAYNSKVNLLCGKQKELLKISKDQKFSKSQRDTAFSRYLKLIDDYEEFTDKLAELVEKKSSTQR